MMKPQRGRTPRKPARQRPKETDPVEVYSRIRPLQNANDESCVQVLSSTTIKIAPPDSSAAVRNGNIKESQYTFQYVFDEYTSQKSLFDHVGLPLVEDVLRGKNALLFAYGVTSSGKTHTMTGTPQDQGILPRCLDVLFNSIAELQARKYVFKPDRMNSFDVQPEVDAMMERQRKEINPRLCNTPKIPSSPRTPGKFEYSQVPRVRDPTTLDNVEEDNNYAIFVSYVEIYNNYVYDLLEELPYDPIKGYKAPTSKVLREDGTHNMYVSNCVEVEVKSTEEAYEVLLKGQKRRKVAHTALNTESSRSHSVFNIRLVQAPLDPRGEEVLQDKQRIAVSQLSLVDLAGSERTGRTGSSGERLKEAGNINNSLMALRACIEALRENQSSGANKMVPYRDSKITHLFKNYFDGEGKVRMIVCVNPKAEEYDETAQVMRFAELTQEVQVARQEQVRFDTGLTPGRRRLHKQYKEAVAKMEEEGVDTDSIPTPFIYSMGPPFPNLELENPKDDKTLITLNMFLKDRMERRATLLTDLANRQEQFRSQLLDVEKENSSLKRKVEELEDKLHEKELECGRLSKKMKTVERDNDSLQKTTHLYEIHNRDLEREIGDREWKIYQEKAEKDRLKQDYRAKIVLTEHNFKNQLESERKKLQEKTSADLRAKSKKLAMVKSIIDRDSDLDSIASSVSSTTLPKSRLLAKSTPDLTETGKPTPNPRPMHLRSTTVSSGSVRKPAPPPLKPKPPMHLRHRRSKSSHEVWLEHKPEPVPTSDALLQPKMRKRKSVTKLTEKATSKANKYVLATHGMDSDGDMATKYVKGDIMATAGGGSAVVFNEVEKLKFADAGVRHWKSKPLRPEDFDGDWTDTEERTRIAVECHGKPRTQAKISRV